MGIRESLIGIREPVGWLVLGSKGCSLSLEVCVCKSVKSLVSTAKGKPCLGLSWYIVRYLYTVGPRLWYCASPYASYCGLRKAIASAW
jgi:hypothetical protein